MAKYSGSVDLVLSTIPQKHNLGPYMDTLKAGGTIWTVGLLTDDTIDFERLNRGGKIIRGSTTGSIKDTQECVDYCIANHIYPEIEVIKIQQLQEVHNNIVNKQARYRYVVDMSSIYE